jgi:hypothetical protein
MPYEEFEKDVWNLLPWNGMLSRSKRSRLFLINNKDPNDVTSFMNCYSSKVDL